MFEEFELELIDELEFEFDEELLDELELELDELLPATMMEPSLLAVLAPPLRVRRKCRQDRLGHRCLPAGRPSFSCGPRRSRGSSGYGTSMRRNACPPRTGVHWRAPVHRPSARDHLQFHASGTAKSRTGANSAGTQQVDLGRPCPSSCSKVHCAQRIRVRHCQGISRRIVRFPAGPILQLMLRWLEGKPATAGNARKSWA